MTFLCTALGVGDAFSARWYSTCLLLEAAGTRLLIDCPHPIRKVLAESGAGVDLPAVDGLLLTHLHGDHCSGVEGMAFFNHFVLRRRVELLGHPDVLERLWPDCLAAGMDRLLRAPGAAPEPLHFADFFTVTALRLDRAVRFGPFSIEARKTVHHVPTTALRVAVDTPEGRRTLGYSADTAFDPELIEWLDEADVVLHETNLGVHTPYERLAALPPRVRSKMRLVHYPDSFDVDGSAIRCLRQGEQLVVGLGAP